MGLAHEKKSYLQEKANLFEIGSILIRSSLANFASERLVLRMLYETELRA